MRVRACVYVCIHACMYLRCILHMLNRGTTGTLLRHGTSYLQNCCTGQWTRLGIAGSGFKVRWILWCMFYELKGLKAPYPKP